MSKKPRNHCKTPMCHGRLSDKAVQHGDVYCSKCRSARHRERNPIQAHYRDLKHRAKQRGHEFTITLAQYTEFWYSSGYGEKHGRTKECLSIDRIRPELGYVPGNIRAKTVSVNTRLQFVPFFKNRADELAAIATLEGYNAKCQAISDALAKIYEPNSEEFIAEYTRAVADIPRPE